MNPIRTKICGITRIKDALTAQEAGADAIGLNFYERSKRYIDPETALSVAEAVKSKTAIVGVFVNSSTKDVCEVAVKVGLTHIQLHGDEQPEFIESLRKQLSSVKIIRAVRMTDDDISAAQVEINQWQTAGVDAVLLDAASLEHFGGTGKQLDWTKLNQLSFAVSWLLAGGLTPQNVAEAMQLCDPNGVDVASGVESSPGVKDTSLVQKFVSESKTR
jgi:phosphoribosylanthranilate isomerase